MSASKSTSVAITPAAVGDLELVNYGAGFAWLRPDSERAELDAAICDATTLDHDITARLGWSEDHPALQQRVAITQAGRDALARALALEACFGPWPTVAEACAA